MIDQDEAQKLWRHIKPIGVGMLSTEDDNVIRARPMQLLQDDFEGKLFFITRKSDHKVKEIKEQKDKICLSFADPERNTYVSVSGEAELISDQAMVKNYWQPLLKPYIPEGPEDEDLAILEVSVEIAEIWDSQSSKMIRLMDLARANVQNEAPSAGNHEKLS